MASDPDLDSEVSGEPPFAPAARRRAESVQRLQVGLSGLGAMILVISLATIVIDRARENEEGAVTEDGAALVDGGEAPPPAKDPLANAGVVPDIGATPTPAANQSPAANATNAPAAQP